MKYQKKPITSILRSSQTVFTFRDIALIWKDTDTKAVSYGLYYYVKTGQLYRIQKGIYAKDKNYDRLELATKLYTPAYVSFETVLSRAGAVFQHYDTIFVATYKTKEIIVDRQTYVLRTLKESILTNPAGVINAGNYFMASPERAFLDTVYLYGKYHFDNLKSLDWSKIFDLVRLYESKVLVQRVKSYHEESKNK